MTTSLTFSEAIEALEKVVAQLESGEATLEEAVDLYTQGMKLSKICQEKLQVAEKKIASIIDENGNEQPFVEGE
ncbi:hypothetical protein GCM10007425_10780 [Lysinibacillus alkalisoli]|uniref:Exodeoxyribonuclease 7 small subunit n=1 Tax=Lysinibacillus alkalisoli TaxID=1911548 RepID=A0A917G280_9BACI|nr:exodeoxyribonuclease VII small subunit [Lysinibacillus alkalisoli]GGG18167.1 hypothetical protein GCM10007425_10780 [Lysinibacillus alkalisoli]